MKKYVKNCQYCDKPLDKKYKNKRFCDSFCRVYWNRENKVVEKPKEGMEELEKVKGKVASDLLIGIPSVVKFTKTKGLPKVEVLNKGKEKSDIIKGKTKNKNIAVYQPLAAEKKRSIWDDMDEIKIKPEDKLPPKTK